MTTGKGSGRGGRVGGGGGGGGRGGGDGGEEGGGGWGGGEGGAASWGGVAVNGGSVNAFLAAALTRVMRAPVPIPASVVHSAAVGGSVVGVVRPL